MEYRTFLRRRNALLHPSPPKARRNRQRHAGTLVITPGRTSMHPAALCCIRSHFVVFGRTRRHYSTGVSLFTFLSPLSPYFPSALRPYILYIYIYNNNKNIFSKICVEHRTFHRRRNVLPSSPTPRWLPAIQPRPAAPMRRQRGSTGGLSGHAAPSGGLCGHRHQN
jgi:hypothetical protein